MRRKRNKIKKWLGVWWGHVTAVILATSFILIMATSPAKSQEPTVGGTFFTWAYCLTAEAAETIIREAVLPDDNDKYFERMKDNAVPCTDARFITNIPPVAGRLDKIVKSVRQGARAVNLVQISACANGNNVNCVPTGLVVYSWIPVEEEPA